MNSPILSIIIPVYNVEEYIEKCINSVLSQTFKDYELILIDDGSTDGSGEICKYFVDTNPQKLIYVYKLNEGQGPTRDLGVKLAKGEYITFLDADDWWAPEFCDQMINAISKSDTDIVVCDINYVEENSHGRNIIVSQIRLPEYQKIIPKKFPDTINRMRTFLWGKVFRRSLYINSGLRQAGHKYQDFPVTAALVAFSQSICRVPFPMYFYYRSRKDSTINNISALDFMSESISDLVLNFKKLNLFETYFQFIEKMAFSQIRFAIKRMNLIDPSGQEQYKRSIQNSLFKVMKEYFPSWINTYELNMCVFGSNTLSKVVSSFLFKDADCKINSEKEYDYIFVDLLDSDDAIKQCNLFKLNIGKKVVVHLFENGKENLFKRKYDVLTEYLPDAIHIYPHEVCILNKHIEETTLWNIADTIWYSLFS